jgi:hypothetical protein
MASARLTLPGERQRKPAKETLKSIERLAY